MDFSTFLEWLVTPSGISAGFGIVMSLIAEYIPSFNRLAPRWKRVVFFGVNLLIPLGGTALGIFTLGWLNVWDPTWWNAIQAGILAFAAGTAVHTRKLAA